MATKKFDLFGQTIETDEHGFFDAPNGERVKWFKPRNLVNGRRVDFGKLLEIVRDYFQDGLTGAQIAKNLSKDTDTIGRYKKIIVAFNALDENAIKNRQVNTEFRNEATTQMLARFESVNQWHDRLIRGGKSRKGTRIFASSLNRVCKILKISPESLCQTGYEGTGKQLDAIDDLMYEVSQTVTSESSFYAIRMAVRSWLDFNKINIPHGNLCPKNLSGKIVSTHGQAAHVRASLDEIALANKYLENAKLCVLPYPKRQKDTEVYFKFGVETASRELAMLTAEMHKWNSTAKQFKTFERKLQHVGKHRMTKRIFCPELIRLLNERQAAGKKCLVGENDEYVNLSEIGNETSDDIHQNAAQKKALKEINENLRAIYEKVGGNMADPYFTKKPSHSLRHVAAQYWLLKSSFDYGFVAELGGWGTIDELKKSYGEMPPEVYEAKYAKYIKSDGSDIFVTPDGTEYIEA